MTVRSKLVRPVALLIVNGLLSGARAFAAKRVLLRCGDVRIGSGTELIGPVRMGSAACLEIAGDCRVGRNLHVDGNGSVHVERGVEIGSDVTFATGASTLDDNGYQVPTGRCTQIVGTGARLGDGVTICGNTRVGAERAVRAGALVTQSSPDDTLLESGSTRVERTVDSEVTPYEN